MKFALGIALIVAGVAFGIYVGLWLCLVGGIIQIVQAFQGSSVDAMDVAVGIVRVLCTGLAGGLTAVLSVLPGMAMLAAVR